MLLARASHQPRATGRAREPCLDWQTIPLTGNTAASAETQPALSELVLVLVLVLVVLEAGWTLPTSRPVQETHLAISFLRGGKRAEVRGRGGHHSAGQAEVIRHLTLCCEVQPA